MFDKLRKLGFSIIVIHGLMIGEEIIMSCKTVKFDIETGILTTVYHNRLQKKEIYIDGEWREI